MKFTFSVPIWGDWYLFRYLKNTLRSHSMAELEGRYVIHTPYKKWLYGFVEKALPKCSVEYIDIKPQNSYFQFSEYYQHCFNNSEACVFLVADAVMQKNTFVSIKKYVGEGYKLIMSAGINSLENDVFSLEGDLNKWAVDNLIPELRGNIWSPGNESMCPLTMYFRDGENFWCNAFYHHPICFVRDRDFDFSHTTIDWIVPSKYAPRETYVLRGDEGLMVELSPEIKFKQHPRFVVNNATDIAYLVRDKIMTNHLDLFRQKIPIVGTPTNAYDGLISDVLEILQSQVFVSKRLTK